MPDAGTQAGCVSDGRDHAVVNLEEPRCDFLPDRDSIVLPGSISDRRERVLARRIEARLLTREKAHEDSVGRRDRSSVARRRSQVGRRHFELFVLAIDGSDGVVDRNMDERHPELRSLNRLRTDGDDRVLRDCIPLGNDISVMFSRFGLSRRLRQGHQPDQEDVAPEDGQANPHVSNVAHRTSRSWRRETRPKTGMEPTIG